MIETKQRILDAAERLFGEQGYEVTSLRQVIAEAEVNIAAVHYHFGTKEDLLDAVVTSKVGPVNEARLARLEQLEARAGVEPAVVEEILEAFLVPTAAVAQANPRFVRLMGRMMSEGMMPRLVERHFQHVKTRFSAALARALPRLSQEELIWRVHFMVGAMAHTMTSEAAFAVGGGDFETRMRRLVKFLGAGFRAPGESGEEK